MSIRTYAELVPPPEPEREVVLHMSTRQAYILLRLLGKCAGNDNGTWPVYEALDALKLPAVNGTYRAWPNSTPLPKES